MKKILLAFSLLVATIGLSVAFINAPKEKAPIPMNGLTIGDTAPDFSLKSVDGEMISLAGVENANGHIVIFTCNTCPYAILYEDRIITLHEKYAAQGYAVVAINPNDPAIKAGDSYEKMQVRAEEKNFPFPYIFDEKQEVFPAYGATKTPHVYLLNKQREVQYIGAIDNNARDAEAVTIRYVEDAIAALQAGKKPAVTFTKAIGCSIKAKK